MKKLIALALVLAVALPSFATIVEGSQVLYEGGTAPGVKEGLVGTFDTSSEQVLVFNAEGTKLAIPYAKVTNFNYEEKLARHYGVILTLLIVPFKYRQRRHILTVNYVDDQNAPRVAVFEIAKTAPETLVPVIQSRINKCQEERRQAKLHQQQEQREKAEAAQLAAKQQ